MSHLDRVYCDSDIALMVDSVDGCTLMWSGVLRPMFSTILVPLVTPNPSTESRTRDENSEKEISLLRMAPLSVPSLLFYSTDRVSISTLNTNPMQ